MESDPTLNPQLQSDGTLPDNSTATSQTTELTNSLVQYASFWQRFFAFLIDGCIVFGLVKFIQKIANIFYFIIDMIYDSSFYKDFILDPRQELQFFSLVRYIGYAVSLAYLVYFTGRQGQTFGKMIMKIKVIDVNRTGKKIGLLESFMREVIGKIISTITLGIGFFSMIKDPKKQTWHDKIAKTIVIKV